MGARARVWPRLRVDEPETQLLMTPGRHFRIKQPAREWNDPISSCDRSLMPACLQSVQLLKTIEFFRRGSRIRGGGRGTTLLYCNLCYTKTANKTRLHPIDFPQQPSIVNMKSIDFIIGLISLARRRPQTVRSYANNIEGQHPHGLTGCMDLVNFLWWKGWQDFPHFCTFVLCESFGERTKVTGSVQAPARSIIVASWDSRNTTLLLICRHIYWPAPWPSLLTSHKQQPSHIRCSQQHPPTFSLKYDNLIY